MSGEQMLPIIESIASNLPKTCLKLPAALPPCARHPGLQRRDKAHYSEPNPLGNILQIHFQADISTTIASLTIRRTRHLKGGFFYLSQSYITGKLLCRANLHLHEIIQRAV
jgi:hypothetical protein